MADITNTTLLNGREYKYEYKLSNSSSEDVKLNDSAVVALSITDNIFNPFVDGFITISNAYNWVEAEFILRGDGTDKLHVKLEPVTPSQKKAGPKEKLEYVFAIVSEQNYIDDSTQSKNRKTYLLVHEDMIALQERFPHEKRYRGKAGDIIKKILEENKLDVDKIEPGDLLIKDFPEYIIPTLNFRYLDLLYYLLQFYYKKDGDIYVKGFLQRDSEKDMYMLKLLTKDYFDKHKELTYESFHSGDLVSQEKNQQTNENNPPYSKDETKTYIGNIVSINVTPASTSISNSFFMNALVTGYDAMLGTMRSKRLRIDKVIEDWKVRFVDVFTAVGGKVKKTTLLTDRKKSDEYKLYRLPFSCKDNTNIVYADMVNSLALYNLQINFNVVGDISRSSGTFIDIYKLKDEKSLGDSRILGTWFMTSVRHVKLLNTLRTEMYGVKTYAGPKFKDKDANVDETQ